MRECWVEWECFGGQKSTIHTFAPILTKVAFRAWFVGYNKLSLKKGFEGKLRVGYVVALSNNVMQLNKQPMQHILEL